MKLIIGAIDLIGSLVFAPISLYRRVRAGAKAPERIVVLRLDQTGDCVQALPFFGRLKEMYPGASVTAVVLESNAFLFNENPDVEKVILAPASWLVKGKKIPLRDIAALISGIRRGNFDLGFDLRGDIRNIALLFFSGVKKITGYGCAGGGFMLDSQAPYDREMHEIDKNLRLLGAGPVEGNVSMKFPVSGDFEAAELLKRHAGGGKKVIVIHPFAGTRAKQWGPDKFSLLAQRLLDLKKDAVIFITGGPQDVKYADQFVFGESMINAIGLKFVPSISLLKKSDIFIGNDSSLQYFAAYQGVKTCVIYGYTLNPLRWMPKVAPENIAAFYTPVDCGPCELPECNQRKHFCMDAVTVDEVFNAVKKWL